MKRTILHFIYDLGRGGAETMLVRVLKELKEYNNIVVTLYPDNHFKGELECTELICLNQGSLLKVPVSAWKLRRLVKKYKPDIVHTHLFWPTMIARMGVPKNVPLITTIHAFIATSVEYRNWYIRFIDKLTYRLRRSVIIGVAKGATAEYFSFLKIKPYRSYALYTFVDMDKFCITHDAAGKPNGTFRLISIGALRLQKNHEYLIRAFRHLYNEDVELHIYGIGPLRTQLEKAIEASPVKVVLKGQMENMEQILPQYDLFVMSSTFEGFSLGVLETMAAKVPMLLSDIVSFREQCDGTAVYFNLQDEQDFVKKLRELIQDDGLRSKMSQGAYERVARYFTLQHHMEQLRSIYTETLNTN